MCYYVLVGLTFLKKKKMFNLIYYNYRVGADSFVNDLTTNGGNVKSPNSSHKEVDYQVIYLIEC